MKKEVLYPLMYELAYLYYGQSEFDKSLEILNYLVDNKNLAYLIIAHNAIELRIVIHYELSNDHLVESLIRSSVRFSQKHKLENLGYRLFLTFLKNGNYSKKTIGDLLTQLENVDDPSFEREGFDKKIWLRSQLEKSSYPETYQKHYKIYQLNKGQEN
ncbi:MAG: hypothetical protein GY810_27145 [Aureispira sp.]|nr:hypothetical protein [Aureispira sp.]